MTLQDALAESAIPSAVPPTGAIGDDPDRAGADVGQADSEPFGARFGDVIGKHRGDSAGPSHAAPIGTGHSPASAVADDHAALGTTSRFHESSVTRESSDGWVLVNEETLAAALRRLGHLTPDDDARHDFGDFPGPLQRVSEHAAAILAALLDDTDG